MQTPFISRRVLLAALGGMALSAQANTAYPNKTISLVVPYELSALRSMPSPGVAAGGLVRLAIGLEAVQDLQADVAQAFKAMRA